MTKKVQIVQLWTAAAILVFCGIANAFDVSDGLIVESVATHSAAAKAGFQTGDFLTGWSITDGNGQSASGEIHPLHTSFEMAELELEQHPFGKIVIHGIRNSLPISLSPEYGKWRLKTRPRWNDSGELAFAKIKETLSADDIDQGIVLTRSTAQELIENGNVLTGAWLLSYAANICIKKRQRPLADELYQAAIDALLRGSRKQEAAYLMYQRSVSLLRASQFDKAITVLSDAIEAHRQLSADRLGISASYRVMGLIETRRSELQQAEAYLQSALAHEQRLKPDSLVLAETISALGRLAITRGEAETAEQYYRQAIEIGRALEPEGGAVASYLNGLAIAFHFQGDEAQAENYWAQSLALEEAIEPDSRDVGFMLHNLGLVKYQRGDFADAERYYLRSLTLAQSRVSGSVEVARTLNNLGSLSLEQGNLPAAESYHYQAMEIRQQKIPNSLDMAVSLTNLGNIARQRGQLDIARNYYEQALAIQEAIAPTTAQAGLLWANIGVLEEDFNDKTKAHIAYQKARSIYAGISPTGRGVAESAIKLGNLALTQDEYPEAEQFFKQALSIFSEIAPDTYQQAAAFYGLARISHYRRDTKLATDYFEDSIAALEAQHARLGGNDESKASVRARHLEPYTKYIEVLLELGQHDRAFDILERSRSKVLSDLLAERDLIFDRDLPIELEQERRKLASTYEKQQAALYSADDSSSVAEFKSQLSKTRQQQDDVRRRIREHSPRLADLKYGSPITLSEVRSTLRPGTALLSYHVGKVATHVFELSPQGKLKVHELTLNENDIDALVKRFRYLIDAGRFDKKPSTALTAFAAELYRHLVLPMENNIKNAERILIIPDGQLDILPFAALMRMGSDQKYQYLAEWKPTFMVNSLTVHTQLRKSNSSATQGRLVAFGDPDYSTTMGNDSSGGTLAVGTQTRASLSELPWSRVEVNGIAGVLGNDASVFVGNDATEERAKRIDRDTQFVHFATHALLDQRVLLDTSIALTIPEHVSKQGENGLLQVWEVYESLRLNADLVTLSGCETALGPHYAGEGLMGLTRAFQYAGASTVLASLWTVNDRSTSDLMTYFYSQLAVGKSQDEALQLAQIAMIHGKISSDNSWWHRLLKMMGNGESLTDSQHPYRWAGFVLSGRAE